MSSGKYIAVNAIAFVKLPHSFYVKTYLLVCYFNISSRLLICLKLPAAWHIRMFYIIYNIIFLFLCIFYISITERIHYLSDTIAL